MATAHDFVLRRHPCLMFATWLDMPIKIDSVKMRMRFDADTVDGIMARLTVLRMRTVPQAKPDDQH